MPGYARPTSTSFSSEVIIAPVGDISSTNLQGALAEIASEKLPVSIIDAKGDLIVGSANDAADRLASGADGFVLTASAAATGGMLWRRATAGATGGGNDAVFYENDTIISTNYTINTNKNAGSFGPVTINNGVTVTVPSGSVWVVV
jgi:hypothetical protein